MDVADDSETDDSDAGSRTQATDDAMDVDDNPAADGSRFAVALAKAGPSVAHTSKVANRAMYGRP